jgi:hypothetical protein
VEVAGAGSGDLGDNTSLLGKVGSADHCLSHASTVLPAAFEALASYP